MRSTIGIASICIGVGGGGMLTWLGQSVWALVISIILVVFGIIWLIVGYKRRKEEKLSSKLLNIGAKVKEIKTYGYYAGLNGSGLTEGDRQVTIDMVLTPSKPMTLDIVALELWGERLDVKRERDTAPFDLIPLAPITLKEVRPYSFTVISDIPKELAIDTDNASVYVLADGSEWRSKHFSIAFGEKNE